MREKRMMPAMPLGNRCPCSEWVMDYRDKPVQPGEYHHRDCKRWHRVIGEAILTKTEFMVLGQPDHDDESHNCDAMGCSSVSHVLVRLPLAEAFPPSAEAHPNA